MKPQQKKLTGNDKSTLRVLIEGELMNIEAFVKKITETEDENNQTIINLMKIQTDGLKLILEKLS